MSEDVAPRNTAHIVWPDWITNKRYSPVEDISTSYASQWYRIKIGETHFELRPAKNRSDNTGPLIQQTYYFISAWNAHAIHLKARDNDSYNETLATELANADLEYQLAVTMQKDFGWYEPSFMVHGWTDDEAREWAWRFGQQAVVKWTPRRLEVLPTDSGEVKKHRSSYELVEITTKLCPMRILERDQPCVANGGPWTSSSRRASWSWQEHRLAIIDLLGCDICGDGSIHPKYVVKTRTIPELKVASRFGGCCVE